MATNPEPQEVMFLAIFLQDIDLEFAYSLGEKLAKNHNGKFNGIFPYTLQTNPLVVLSNLNFSLDRSKVNAVSKELQSALKANMKFQVIPLPQQEKPLPTGMIG